VTPGIQRTLFNRIRQTNIFAPIFLNCRWLCSRDAGTDFNNKIVNKLSNSNID
jgi:hypothetical protein